MSNDVNSQTGNPEEERAQQPFSQRGPQKGVQTNQEPSQGSYGGSVADDEIDLLGLLGALLDNRWTIINITSLAAVIAVMVALLSTPIYQAGALLQVEEKTASLPGLEDLAEAFASEYGIPCSETNFFH